MLLVGYTCAGRLFMLLVVYICAGRLYMCW